MGGRIIPFISDSTFTKQVRVWKLVGIWGLLPFLSTTQLSYTSTHKYIHHSISPYGVQVGNHCPFLPPYLTWYLRRPFSYCRWYGGGVGPFDHGVSCQFVVQHFEISLPSSFFCPISSYITISSNIVYLPILTGIVSVMSLCSIIHKWFPWQYPELS